MSSQNIIKLNLLMNYLNQRKAYDSQYLRVYVELYLRHLPYKEKINRSLNQIFLEADDFESQITAIKQYTHQLDCMDIYMLNYDERNQYVLKYVSLSVLLTVLITGAASLYTVYVDKTWSPPVLLVNVMLNLFIMKYFIDYESNKIDKFYRKLKFFMHQDSKGADKWAYQKHSWALIELLKQGKLIDECVYHVANFLPYSEELAFTMDENHPAQGRYRLFR